jgi:hypothetical protein
MKKAWEFYPNLLRVWSNRQPSLKLIIIIIKLYNKEFHHNLKDNKVFRLT